MKDVIILEKIREKKELLVGIVDTNMLAEMAKVLSLMNLTRSSIWVINNGDLNVAKK